MNAILPSRWIPWIGFVLALGMHLWHLGTPAVIVGDEVYFVKDAQYYQQQKYYVDAHPPLGKLQIALAIKLFGDRPWAWRMVNAVEGALMVPVLWWLGVLLTNRRRVGAMAAFFALTDGFLLADSRLGVINIPYILYALMAMGCILESFRRRWLAWTLAAGIMIGLAISVKWLALSMVVPTIVLWWWPSVFGLSRKVPFPYWGYPVGMALLLFLPMALYILIWHWHFLWLGRVDETIKTNVYLWIYHHRGNTGNAYRQEWWNWMILWQPWLYYYSLVGNKISAMWSMGNPVVWLSGIPVLFYSLVRKWKQSPYRLLNIFLLATWLPFAFIRRDMFLYHAMPFGMLLFLLLSISLYDLSVRWKKISMYYLALVFIVFIWFLPWWLNIPLSQQQYRLRQWLPHWGQMQT